MEDIVSGKVVFVGDTRVGKTAIINRYNNVDIDGPQTVGANSIPTSVTISGCSVQLNVWDTAGQEVFKCLLPMYSRGAQAAVVVFDINERASFDSVPGWIDFLREDIDLRSIVMVANKTDLVPAVTEEDLRKLRSQYPRASFFMTSALTGSGIGQLFTGVAEVVRQASLGEDNKVRKVTFKPIPITESRESPERCC